jgi:hypothetical protein
MRHSKQTGQRFPYHFVADRAQERNDANHDQSAHEHDELVVIAVRAIHLEAAYMYT